MSAQDNIQRAVLPIPDQPHMGLTTYDAKDPDTKFPPIRELRPPAGAPNVLIILLDDVGFGASSVFGGPCRTPNFERLAADGLRYNRFHTTALCSPTRQALLTGRNHHSVNMGGICEIATSAPGYSSVLPKNKAPLADDTEAKRLFDRAVRQMSRSSGVGDEPNGPVRPMADRRRRLRVFLRFPRRRNKPMVSRRIYEGTTPVEPDKTPEEGYHFTEDMTDKAIKWIRQQKALMPDKPFFALFRTGRHTRSPSRQ